MQDLPIGQLTGPGMDGGDRRLVLMLGPPGKWCTTPYAMSVSSLFATHANR